MTRAKNALYRLLAPRARLKVGGGRVRSNLADRIVYWLERHP